MARKSVQEDLVVKRSIAGLDDLLINPHQDFDDPERVCAAATNVLYLVDEALKAVGPLVWKSAQQDEDGLSNAEQFRVGLLIEHLELAPFV